MKRSSVIRVHNVESLHDHKPDTVPIGELYMHDDPVKLADVYPEMVPAQGGTTITVIGSFYTGWPQQLPLAKVTDALKEDIHSWVLACSLLIPMDLLCTPLQRIWMRTGLSSLHHQWC